MIPVRTGFLSVACFLNCSLGKYKVYETFQNIGKVTS